MTVKIDLSRYMLSIRLNLLDLSIVLSLQMFIENGFPGCDQHCGLNDVGNGKCDKACNISKCYYDFGDCGVPTGECSETIQSNDQFLSSIQFVHGLFNKEFGYTSRRMPAHMPILIVKDVASKLYNRFEWLFQNLYG